MGRFQAKDCTDLTVQQQTELYQALTSAAIGFAEKNKISLSTKNSNLYHEIDLAVRRACSKKADSYNSIQEV